MFMVLSFDKIISRVYTVHLLNVEQRQALNFCSSNLNRQFDLLVIYLRLRATQTNCQLLCTRLNKCIIVCGRLTSTLSDFAERIVTLKTIHKRVLNKYVASFQLLEKQFFNECQ